MRKAILITFRTRTNDREIIREMLADFADIYYLENLSPNEREEVLPRINIVLTGSGRDLTEDLLKYMRQLEMVQTLSAGVDYVPFAIIPKNVIVCSNAGGNALAVAEHAVAMLLAASKKIVYHHENMRKGIWRRRVQGILLRGKILAIIGFGNIGKNIARIMRAFGVKIYAINRSGKTDENVDFIGTLKDLEFVLSNADFIVLALPLTKQTKNLITKRELSIMKKNAILVNVARGPIINQKDLYEHLRENPSFIAALDVWWRYPKESDEVIYQDYPFHELDNVIMTPHIAGFSNELREHVIRHALMNIRRYLEGEKPINIVDRSDYV